MRRSCLEKDVLKGIKPKHKNYLFHGSAYMDIDRVASVEAVIQYELENFFLRGLQTC